MVNNELLSIMMIVFLKNMINFDFYALRCVPKTSKIVEILLESFSARTKKELSPLL